MNLYDRVNRNHERNHEHRYDATGEPWPRDRRCACGVYRVEKERKPRWLDRAGKDLTGALR